ncbi:MAG: amidohydrolase family protein [Dehalococcoidia bacterium]
MTAAPDRRSLVIDGARLIDGTGNPAIEDSVLVIVGDRITEFGPRGRVRVPPDATVIDGREKTVLPGLIDVHVHDSSDENMALYVKNGVTSIRFAGGEQASLLALRGRVEREEIPGPRIFSVGHPVDATPHAWPGSKAVDSPIEARRLIRRLVEEDQADAILATHRVSRSVLTAIVETAHELGVPVTGQTWTAGPDDILAAGIDGLENTSRIPESAAWPLERLFRYRSVSERLAHLAHLWVDADWDRTTELAHQFAEAGIALAPELVSFEGWARTNDAEVKSDRDWPQQPGNPQVIGYERHVDYLTVDWSDADYTAQAQAVDRYREFCRIFHRAGGLLVAGTDMGFGGILLHRELWHFQQAGLTPIEAIRTGARAAASALAIEDLGQIAQGSRADVVVVAGNPAQDLAALRNVEDVLIGGRPVVRAGALIQPVGAQR